MTDAGERIPKKKEEKVKSRGEAGDKEALRRATDFASAKASVISNYVAGLEALEEWK